MPFKITFSIEVICALISLLGVVFSALISRNIAKTTANKEIEKMKLEWAHNDSRSLEDEIAAMISAVSKFCHSAKLDDLPAALEKVAALRHKETGAMAQNLDQLYYDLKSCNPHKSGISLNKVVAECRRRKGDPHAYDYL